MRADCLSYKEADDSEDDSGGDDDDRGVVDDVDEAAGNSVRITVSAVTC